MKKYPAGSVPIALRRLVLSLLPMSAGGLINLMTGGCCNLTGRVVAAFTN